MLTPFTPGVYNLLKTTLGYLISVSSPILDLEKQQFYVKLNCVYYSLRLGLHLDLKENNDKN